jgi:hypothetical protein
MPVSKGSGKKYAVRRYAEGAFSKRVVGGKPRLANQEGERRVLATCWPVPARAFGPAANGRSRLLDSVGHLGFFFTNDKRGSNLAGVID